jgi:uncharacterized membrane protein
MWMLWLGVALFAGPHLFSTLLPGTRDGFKASLGEGPFKGIYALLSLAGLVLLALAYLDGRAGPNALDVYYQPAEAARHITMLLALVGFILLAGSHGKGHIRKIVKHPMSLGVGLWSLGHLLANGEKAVVVIFGMLLVVSVVDIIFSTARGKVPSYEPNLRSDIIAVVAGVIVYAVMAFGFHPFILNVPVQG